MNMINAKISGVFISKGWEEGGRLRPGQQDSTG